MVAIKNMKYLFFNIYKNIILDDEDFVRVALRHWHLNRKEKDGRQVLATDINGKTTSIGRFILKYDGPLEVDHIDKNIYNNQKSNLRLATRAQQMMNSKPQLDREYKGVWKVKHRYRASLKFNQKQIHGGYYNTPEQAAKAYDKLAKRYFGVYALLNFPEEVV